MYVSKNITRLIKGCLGHNYDNGFGFCWLSWEILQVFSSSYLVLGLGICSSHWPPLGFSSTKPSVNQSQVCSRMSMNSGLQGASGLILICEVRDKVFFKENAAIFSHEPEMLLGPDQLHSWEYHLYLTSEAYCALAALLTQHEQDYQAVESQGVHRNGIQFWQELSNKLVAAF